MNTRPVRVTDEADVDLTNAAQWYAERNHTVAVAFVEEVYDCFNVIRQFPNGAPRVRGFIRQLPVSGFPFLILYRPITSSCCGSSTQAKTRARGSGSGDDTGVP